MTRAVRNTPPVSSLANEGDRTAPAFSPLGSTNGASPGGDPTAFHATAPVTNPLRRGLLVFFDFAPSAEVGALRWISLVGCGAERGWAFDVVALEPQFMGPLDMTRLERLPPGVRMFGFTGENPAWYRAMLRAARRAGWVGTVGAKPSEAPLGGHLDGSDRTVALGGEDASLWRRAFRSRVHFQLADALARRAAALGSRLAAKNRYDIVVSSGPPHAAHDAARRIAARHALPIVMDMRDPWSDDSAMPSEFRSDTWRRLAQRHERDCVSAASLLVVTSKAHEELQVAKYPALRGRVRTVMNGADREPLPPSRIARRFVVGFAGMIYLGRDPRPLFEAAARVARATGATPDEFGVEFMGDDACEGIPLTTIAAEAGLGEHFVAHGFRPRRDALQFLAGVSLLVSLPLRTTVTIPAKLFEYMRFDAWLFALAEPAGATEALLRDTEADVIAPHDMDGIERVIAKRFAEFRAGIRPTSLNHDGRFDRSTQAALFFDAAEELAARSSRRTAAG